MKTILLINACVCLTFALNAQCDQLTQRFDLPVQYSIKSQLDPDPCDAKSDYRTKSELVYSPISGYQEIKKQVKVITATTYDPDNCKGKTEVVSVDTTEISNKIFGAKKGQTTGGYWTMRLELMVLPPASRPQGSMATKLPLGESKEGYWVIHVGTFVSAETAKKELKLFKNAYPEFCRAYVYYLPSNCEYQYKYLNVNE